jgi:phage gp36-like protein
MRRIAGLLIGFVALVSAVFLVVVSIDLQEASAENPSDVVPDLADDGVYVAPRRAAEVDPTAFLPVIERARIEGLSMYVLWPEEPQPNTGAFARRVQEATEVDVVLVFGPDGSRGNFVSEEYEEAAIRATSAARAFTEPVAEADAFLTGLLEEPVRDRPAIINDLVRWIAILLGVLVAGAVGEQAIRQYKKARQRQALRASREG